MSVKQERNYDDYIGINDCDYCEHFEPQKSILVPMKECWYCKWSDFRNERSLSKESICHYEENSNSKFEEERHNEKNS